MKLRATIAIVALMATGAVVSAATPAGAADPSSDPIIAIRGLDNAVWVRTLPEGSPIGSLRAWRSLGGATSSAPAVSRSTVIIRGLDNAIWVNEHNSSGDTWSGWQSLGGATADGPVTNSYGDVYIRGLDGAVHTRYHKSSYDPWESLGGNIVGAPAVGSDDAVAVRGTDNAIYLNRARDGGWGGWEPLGGATTDTPAVTADGLDAAVVIRGLDGALWGRDVPETGPPSPWFSAGGTIVGAPLFAQDAVVVRSPGGGAYVYGEGWTALPGRYLGLAGGGLGVIGRGLDDALYLITDGAALVPLGGRTTSTPAGSPASGIS